MTYPGEHPQLGKERRKLAADAIKCIRSELEANELDKRQIIGVLCDLSVIALSEAMKLEADGEDLGAPSDECWEAFHAAVLNAQDVLLLEANERNANDQ